MGVGMRREHKDGEEEEEEAAEEDPPQPSRKREGLESGWVRADPQRFADEIVDNICIDP
jgi:hypothetical protein